MHACHDLAVFYLYIMLVANHSSPPLPAGHHVVNQPLPAQLCHSLVYLMADAWKDEMV